MSTNAPQGTAAAMLEVAARNVGFVEGPRNNENPYAKVAEHANFQPWCATFLVACARRAGVTLPSESAYTPTMANGFKKIGRYDKNPKRGDIVFFFWPNMGRIAHVGVVVSVNEDGSVNTIEGNTNAGGSRTGGGVFRLVRRANIDGFGHPEYAEEGAPAEDQATPAPAPKPVRNDIRLGDRGTKVEQVQRDLNKHGIKVTVDGDFGPATEKAVKAFQTKAKTTVDGIVGPTTQRLLSADAVVVKKPAPTPPPPVKKANPFPVPVLTRARPTLRAGGSKTKIETQYVQWACGAATDGKWGPLTTGAVRNFQRRQGILADGQVGPVTLRKMQAVRR